jgi:hypothetical protein
VNAHSLALLWYDKCTLNPLSFIWTTHTLLHVNDTSNSFFFCLLPGRSAANSLSKKHPDMFLGVDLLLYMCTSNFKVLVTGSCIAPNSSARHARHRGPGEARFGLRVGTRQNSRWRTGPDHALDLRYGIRGVHNEIPPHISMTKNPQCNRACCS